MDYCIMENMSAVWDGVLTYLMQSMNLISYNNWIKNLTPVAIKDNTLVLAAENEATRDTIEKMYKDLIIEAVRVTSGVDISVTITSSEAESFVASDEIFDPMLNPKYTFDTFVVGDSNRFANAACLAVAERPAEVYNPLFIYGGVGLGKTHLMHALGHMAHKFNKDIKVLYVTSEAFTNELIQAVREGKNAEFRQKYRNIDILMVDDIQFLAGKTSTQSEFFHTFNTLFVANKQIVLTSDRSPREIPTLDARMYSRFECGLVADISQPDFETRAAILKKRADTERIIVSDEVLFYIAEKIQSNVRELEGAFTRVLAHSQLTGSKISTSLVDKVLADMLQRSNTRRITSEMVIQAVSEYYSISVEEILGKKRDKQIALARQVSMFLCRKLMDSSFEDIGNMIGGKHYTTVMHACDKITEYIKNNQRGDVKVALDDIEGRLMGK